MTPSDKIATFMKGYETFQPHAMLPTPNDQWTIGFGQTAGVRKGMVWTRAQADADFAARLNVLGMKVWARVSSARLTLQCQFDAMCSLADNIGLSHFYASSVLTNHLAGHGATAALAFGLWNKQQGSDGQLHVLEGLTKRRAAEAMIYAGGRYDAAH